MGVSLWVDCALWKTDILFRSYPALCPKSLGIGSRFPVSSRISAVENGWRDGWIYGWVDGRMDEWINGQMGGWADEWMDAWMDGRING